MVILLVMTKKRSVYAYIKLVRVVGELSLQ